MKTIFVTLMTVALFTCTPVNRHIDVSKEGLKMSVQEKTGEGATEKTENVEYKFQNRNAYVVTYHAAAVLKQTAKTKSSPEEGKEEFFFLSKNEISTTKLLEVMHYADVNGDKIITEGEAKHALEDAEKIVKEENQKEQEGG